MTITRNKFLPRASRCLQSGCGKSLWESNGLTACEIEKLGQHQPTLIIFDKWWKSLCWLSSQSTGIGGNLKISSHVFFLWNLNAWANLNDYSLQVCEMHPVLCCSVRYSGVSGTQTWCDLSKLVPIQHITYDILHSNETWWSHVWWRRVVTSC